MEIIRFTTVVGQDQVIRPPSGITLPQGEIEVTVHPYRSMPPSAGDPLAATRAWLLDFAAEAQRAAPELPADLAVHHDHYAHGKPLP